jgi:glutamine amidotransferase
MTMIHIVDYGVGNCGSIANMLSRLGIENRIEGEPAGILTAERLILPGVGAFDAGMQNLEARGLAEPLRKAVLERKTPVLGICLGMQLLGKGSEEGMFPGLGLVDAHCVRFDPAAASDPIKVPHMGWAEIDVVRPNQLFAENEPARFYFVHSYHVVCAQRDVVTAEADHGMRFTAAFEQGPIYGVQFHPEKSHRFGMRLMQAFAKVPAACAHA